MGSLIARRRFFRYVGGVVVALALACGRHSRTNATAVARRVISLSPSTTEVLFAVGAGNRVVGRSRFCDYPDEVRSIPSVGGYVDASLETILGLRPDLVVGARGPAGRALTDKLEAFGIPTFFPPTESMAAIDRMIVDVATRVGANEQGARVVEKLATRRRSVTAAVADQPLVRTLLVFGVLPIVAAGPDSFADEMIRLARGENVVTTGGAYPALSVERLVTLKPDVVINASMAGIPGARGDNIGRDDPGWRELSAVREGRVIALTDEAVLRPGPRIADGLATLARAIHPGTAVP
ncbi:MAG TPA: helical backbone metal receptor [Polyangiaceae bacterium]